MLAITIFNIADTIFVGRGVGTLALAGVSVSLPFIMTVTNFGMAIGIGGSSIISRALGSGDNERAELVLNNIFKLIILTNIAVIVLAAIFLDPLLILFGANPEILPYARTYSGISLIGAFFMNIINVNMNTIRAEGNVKFVMWIQTFSAILNIILDPIFIFVFKWGVAGAAIATVISQALGGIIAIWYYYHYPKRVLQFKAWSFMQPLNKAIVKETVAIGASSFARHVSNSVMNIALFHALYIHSGSAAIAAFGIVFRLLMFTYMPIFGINQGFMPIVGYNFGAGNLIRVIKAIRLANISATVFAVVSMFAMLIWSRELIAIFTTDFELIELGNFALKIVVLAFPVLGMQIVGSGLYQALGKAKESFFLAIVRQIVFLIPLVLILPIYFGLVGIWASFPISDFLASVITIFMVIYQVKFLKKMNFAKPTSIAG